MLDWLNSELCGARGLSKQETQFRIGRAGRVPFRAGPPDAANTFTETIVNEWCHNLTLTIARAPRLVVRDWLRGGQKGAGRSSQNVDPFGKECTSIARTARRRVTGLIERV